MIGKCTCGNRQHQQDAIHGKGNRVFNPLAKKDKEPQMYRCTVCAAVIAGPNVAKSAA
jgi:hypothetical protein